MLKFHYKEHFFRLWVLTLYLFKKNDLSAIFCNVLCASPATCTRVSSFILHGNLHKLGVKGHLKGRQCGGGQGSDSVYTLHHAPSHWNSTNIQNQIEWSHLSVKRYLKNFPIHYLY